MKVATLSVSFPDNMVYVNGMGVSCDLSKTKRAPGVKVIQWRAAHYEFDDGRSNEFFTNPPSDLEEFVLLWKAARKIIEEENRLSIERAEKKRQEEAEIAAEFRRKEEQAQKEQEEQAAYWEAQKRLAESDVVVVRCHEGNITVPEEWKSYREELRGIVRNAPANISDVKWPEAPEKPDFS